MSKKDLAWVVLAIFAGFGFAIWSDHRRAAEENAYVCSVDGELTQADIRDCFEFWGVAVPKGY